MHISDFTTQQNGCCFSRAIINASLKLSNVQAHLLVHLMQCG